MKYDDFDYNNYKLIYNSCLFEEQWYLKKYLKNTNNINPIFHYLIEGAYQGNNPNPIFDSEYYLNINPDVKNANLNPLIHYIKSGKKENRSFSPNFKIKKLSLEEELFFIFEENEELKLGVKKIIELNLFDSDWYLKKYKEVKASNTNPLIHYIKIGANENKNPSPTFDTRFYLIHHPKIKEKRMNPLIHYAIYGQNKKIKINENNKFDMGSESEKFQYLYNRLNTLENKIEKEIFNRENSLKNYKEFINFIYLNENIKAKGILRDIQLQTFEMLRFIVKLCEKNSLTYWLDYGTLIGAIRHKGFVPWDDEIDMCLPREDFEKLVKIILKELDKHEVLNEKVHFRIPFETFRNEKTIDLFPSPTVQFVNSIPLANVDIHVSDYYDITPSNAKQLSENSNFYKTIRNNFSKEVKNKNYENLEDFFIETSEKVGITFEKTLFMGSSLDGGFKTPTHIEDIFPLKKVYFEGYEFNSPNNPKKYLSNAYYTGDIMKIPSKMQTHNRSEKVLNQLSNVDIKSTFKKEISFWKLINMQY